MPSPQSNPARGNVANQTLFVPPYRLLAPLINLTGDAIETVFPIIIGSSLISGTTFLQWGNGYGHLESVLC